MFYAGQTRTVLASNQGICNLPKPADIAHSLVLIPHLHYYILQRLWTRTVPVKKGEYQANQAKNS